jgi:hypothetical protein
MTVFCGSGSRHAALPVCKTAPSLELSLPHRNKGRRPNGLRVAHITT